MPSFLYKLTEVDQKSGDWEDLFGLSPIIRSVQKVLSNHIYPVLEDSQE